MRTSPLSLLIAGIVGSSATAAVTVMASAYAFGGATGYVVVEPRNPRISARPAISAIRESAPDEAAQVIAGVIDVPAAVRERLADPRYAATLLRDEPTALRFLFDSALAMNEPEEAWSVLDEHGVFAAHLGRGSWERLVNALDEAGSDLTTVASDAAQELFGPSFVR
ncbi:MAG: hypothetical protein AAF726_01355 [Planctomycetota bacterium]